MLAELDRVESDRVSRAVGAGLFSQWRLEFHDYEADFCEVRDPDSGRVTGFAISEEAN